MTAVSCLRSPTARTGSPHDPAKDFAETIRSGVKDATACESKHVLPFSSATHGSQPASISSTMSSSSGSATRHAKPAVALHLLPADVPELIATLDITDLWGFTGSHRDKAREARQHGTQRACHEKPRCSATHLDPER